MATEAYGATGDDRIFLAVEQDRHSLNLVPTGAAFKAGQLAVDLQQADVVEEVAERLARELQR